MNNCKLCGKEINANLVFCNNICRQQYEKEPYFESSYKHIVPMEDKYKCIKCNTEFISATNRNKHIKLEHKLSYEQYIMHHYFNNVYPTCKCGCGTVMKFIDTPFGLWFKDYTKNHFPRKEHTEETKKQIGESCKKHFIEKYGVDNPRKAQVVKDRIKQVKLERYGDANYNNTEKSKQTCLERHGVRNALQNKDIRQKVFTSQSRKSYRLKEYVLPDNRIIFYQSAPELIYIQQCIIRNIYIENGDTIEYSHNNKKHYYYVDFKIKVNDKYQLIEIKGKNKWYYNDIQSGVFYAKKEAAINYSLKMNYLPFKIILFDRHSFTILH